MPTSMALKQQRGSRLISKKAADLNERMGVVGEVVVY